ncbi:MAG: type II toxin-antitoxin system VapC family toxin [Acidobacteriota bacterium]|nr:type II toxin-antitoxin system VapC family toxin [Acidobacteriota bacterium]
MKALYLESSALLAWLLGESSAAEVKKIIDEADTVVTSVLTILEAERALIRAESASLLSAGDAEKLKGLLAQSSVGWALMEISEDVRHRAGRYFPAEPVRTLDAIHLATALLFMRVFPSLEMLSYDQRILRNAIALGIGTTGAP